MKERGSYFQGSYGPEVQSTVRRSDAEGGGKLSIERSPDPASGYDLRKLSLLLLVGSELEFVLLSWKPGTLPEKCKICHAQH